MTRQSIDPLSFLTRALKLGTDQTFGWAEIQPNQMFSFVDVFVWTSTVWYPAVTYAAAEHQGRLFWITCKWLKAICTSDSKFSVLCCSEHHWIVKNQTFGSVELQLFCSYISNDRFFLLARKFFCVTWQSIDPLKFLTSKLDLETNQTFGSAEKFSHFGSIQITELFYSPDKDFCRVLWVTGQSIDPLSFLTRALVCPGARTWSNRWE